jgi:FtsZ-binding cell division protein ZapB
MGEAMNDWIREFEDLREDNRVLKAEVRHLRAMMEEAEKTIVALRQDRDFYRDELARRG